MSKLIALAFAFLGLLAGWQFYRAERSISAHAQTKAAFSEYRATQAKEHAQALEKVRADGDRIRKTQQDAQDAEYLARVAAEADADRARAAANGLRQRAAVLAAAAARCPAGDPAIASSSPTADAPGDLLAELLDRVDQAAGEIGRYADQARRSGQLCERSYEALTP